MYDKNIFFFFFIISVSSNNIVIVLSLIDRIIYNLKYLWYFLFYIYEMFGYKFKNF